MIKIGPAGIGHGEDTLPKLKKLGIKTAEVEFVRQVYMTNSKAKQMGEIAEKNNIQLSVHAPYYINLNSEDKSKVRASRKRILDSCERGHHLGAKYIVFHPGYFGKREKKETFENIKNELLEINKTIKQRSYKKMP